MIATIARFELRRNLRAPRSLVYGLILFAVAFLAENALAGAFDSVTGGSGQGKPFANAPFFVHIVTSFIGCLSLTICAAIAGDSLLQDFEHRTYAMILSTPLGTPRYLAGRWLGALGTLLVLFVTVPLGLFVATKMPWLSADRLGPNHVSYYVLPYLVATVPMVLFACSLFFGIAAWARAMAPVHVAGVTLLVGYLISRTLSDGVHDRVLAELLDPFGLKPSSDLTEYWTTAQRNVQLVVPHGTYLVNRILWPLLGVIVGLVGCRRFRPAEPQSHARTKAGPPPAATTQRTRPHIDPSIGHFVRWAPRLVLSSVRQLLAMRQFRVLAAVEVVLVLAASRTAGQIFGTKTWPVTYQMTELLDGTMALMLFALASIASAELVFRDRQYRMQQVVDALPTPSPLHFWLSFCSVALVQLVLVAIGILVSIGLQLGAGYHHLELGLYATTMLGISLPTWLVFTAVALVAHTLSPSRSVGHSVLLVCFFVPTILGKLGVEHRVYLFNDLPPYTYSDMNRFGPYVAPIVWFRVYWGCFAVAVLALGQRLWPRGEAKRPRTRLASHGVPWAAVIALVGMIGTGAYIHHQTDVVNHFVSEKQAQRDAAKTEQKYRRFLDEPQPTITAVELHVDLWPRELRARLAGTYVVKNEATRPVTTVLLRRDVTAKIARLDFDRPAQVTKDDELGIDLHALGQPLAPGESMTLTFALDYANRGFHNDGEPTAIAENGTFISSGFFPHLGYDENDELDEDDIRKREKLGPRHRLPAPDDPRARLRNYVSADSNFVSFVATVSTDLDQTALAPGDLERTWEADGRRWFTYRTPQPIVGFWSILSGRYAVARDVVDNGGAAPITIEIDHHPAHTYDIARMMDAAKKSLTAFSTRFSPYPRRSLHIVEFPRYASFAQSFPALIPFSEGIGFIARVDPTDDKDIDYPFYVTAHEIAHQWWAHQLIGGRAQGATLLSESLAQYSALTLMKKEVGREQMSRFLTYELHHYLMGRAGEAHEEQPLARVENQLYIHYNKGSLALYYLADVVGEDVIDRALRDVLAKFAGQGPPYATSTDLVAALRAELPPTAQLLVGDLLEKVILWDNRVRTATMRELPSHLWEVTIVATLKKVGVDDKSEEHELSIDEPVPVGAVDAHGHLLTIERPVAHGNGLTATFTTKEKPARAGVDPLHELVDRSAEDNLMDVSVP
ncbi:MAG: M1 family aminopeptidase [Polyangia bacterium]